jgi:uncharacterized protein YjbI with pentapeptide repeats
MLADFFKLDEPYQEASADDLSARLGGEPDVQSLLFKADDWPSDARKVRSVRFRNVSLSKTVIREVTFTECTFTDCLFIGTRFEKVEFHRCHFLDCNFYKSEFFACYIDPKSVEFNKKYHTSAANIGTSLFQSLLENATNTKQPEFVVSSDIEFRRWKRRQLAYDVQIKKITRWERIKGALWSHLYEMLAGFGYKPLRFALVTLVLFSGITLVNKAFLDGSLSVDGTVVRHMTWPDAIFYSYSILTVLGFSTITPTSDCAKILAVSEALVGIGWLGLFTSILVKRVLK